MERRRQHDDEDLLFHLKVSVEELTINGEKKDKKIIQLERELYWLLKAVGHLVKKVRIPTYVDGKIKHVDVWLKRSESSFHFDTASDDKKQD